ncbi:MAG: hypothetical protein GX790_10360, partial [Syntrophomonadaceae bacterium]|nr:hypothetical protein [Syntrophomonadaceae bacterium]
LYAVNDVDSVTLYLSGTEGVFDPSGELFVNDENFVGIYEQLLSENEAESAGGFWMIMTYPDEFDPTSFKYENAIQFDNGTGLVYRDLKPASDLSAPNLYYNIQDTVQEIGQFATERNRVSWISHLSYFGDPEGEENTDQLSKIWVARLGTGVSVATGAEVEFRVYDSVNHSVDFEAVGFDKEQVNSKHVVEDLWDGYIDVELTPTQQGEVFTLEEGDVVENVQTPFNAQGGLSITSQSTGTAKVVHVQRQFNNVRVYVKIEDGTTWNKINNLALARLRRIRINEPNRIIGVINDYDNDVAVGTLRVGKLAVFHAESDFPVVNSPVLIEEEYYLYNEDVTPGIEREANPPFKLNRDYSQVYNIVYDEHGVPVTGYEQEGAVAVYRRRVNGTYELVNILVSEYRGSNRRFGNKVRIAQFDNFYTLLIGSEGASGELAPGSIEIYRHGVRSTDQFTGPHNSINSYARNDIVVYRDSYYKALHSVPMDIDINNRSYWENISWYRGKDKNYRGEFSLDYDYAQNSVVAYQGKLYRAMTNVVANAGFNENVWTPLSTKIDYLGYLPNLTCNAFYDEEVFNPLEGISQFSYSFDVSDNGEVLIVTSRQAGPDSALENKIVVYRLDGEKYLVDQVISPIDIDDISTPEMQQYLANIDRSALVRALDSIGAGPWATTMSMNPTGTHFAVGLPTKDSNKAIQGTVYVFTFEPNKGKFIFSQILRSPNNEEVEKFGSSMYFGDDNLVIASLNGDQKIPVTFDASLERETTFDNKFTTFNNIIIDTGAVYVYEHLNDKMVYAEQFRYDLASRDFGNVVVAHSNHIYLGMPSQIADDSSSAGTIADFRKSPGTFAWKQKRSQVIPVDVNRINGAMLYNKRKNRVIAYVDYIDAVQGKIAGPAEQEITYKTGFDPAVYNA